MLALRARAREWQRQACDNRHMPAVDAQGLARWARWYRRATTARAARILWVIWAVLLWNVVLDHTIEVAARQYIVAARRAAYSSAAPHHYENMDDWMRPAVSRGLWLATGSAALVMATGFALLRIARVGSAEQ
jgi:hypothetical protein